MRIISFVFLLGLTMPSLAREPISLHWPMPYYTEYAGQKSKQIRPDVELGASIRLPMLMAYSAKGKLVWMDNPLDHALETSTVDNHSPSNDLAEILERIERAQANRSDANMSTTEAALSSLLDIDQPTLILVIFSHRQGVCPPCDRATQHVKEEFPQEWNRILVSVFSD